MQSYSDLLYKFHQSQANARRLEEEKLVLNKSIIEYQNHIHDLQVELENKERKLYGSESVRPLSNDELANYF